MTTNTLPTRELAARIGERARLDEPLWRHTSYRIGGPADVFLLETANRHLMDAVDAATELGIPWRVIGSASNLLISDLGVEGLVLKSVARSVRFLRGDSPGDTLIHADAGCMLAAVAKRAAAAGLGGLEWASTVPGTVGAAVTNNSGAFGSCTAEHLVNAVLYFPGQGQRSVDAHELVLDYRTSRLKRGEWRALVLGATLRVTPGDADELRARLVDLDARRRATQPLGPSVGSVFRNPPDGFAGELIERAGCKGLRSGEAEISPLHGNFILNRGHAQARDVLDLVQRAQRTVWESQGVWLVPEIELVGRWSPAERGSLEAPPR